MNTPIGRVTGNCVCESVNGTWYKGGPETIHEDCTLDDFTLDGKPCAYTFIVNGVEVGPVARVHKGDRVGVKTII